MNNSNKSIINDIQFDEMGCMIENYNLQGYEIVVTSLSWAPYHSHKNCNELGRQCENYGLLADLMNIWALDYNFTWDVYHDLNNDWGLNPKEGKSYFILQEYPRISKSIKTPSRSSKSVKLSRMQIRYKSLHLKELLTI